MQLNTITLGDCREILATLPENSVDAVVTDPPYELGFMYSKDRTWDKTGVSFDAETWRQVLRVLKPGGHLLAFGGSRTSHRITCAIEDAGFEIRDVLQWIYSTGFPKSLNIAKAFEKNGVETCGCLPTAQRDLRQVRSADLPPSVSNSEATGEVLLESLPKQNLQIDGGTRPESQITGGSQSGMERRGDVSASAGQLCSSEIHPLPGGVPEHGPEGRLHNGAPPNNSESRPSDSQPDGSCSPLGSRSDKQQPGEPRALADQQGSQTGRAWPICAGCSKPVSPEGWGTALKPAYEPIVMARKPLSEGTVAANVLAHGTGGINVDGCRIGVSEADAKAMERANTPGSARFQKGEFFKGLDAAQPYETTKGRWPANILFDESAAQILDLQTGVTSSTKRTGVLGEFAGQESVEIGHSDSGGASRFFYCAKASRSERNAGLEAEPEVTVSDGREKPIDNPFLRGETARKNPHPTVKPLAVMEWLVTLVTPPGGIVLDPFAGSGSTLCAAAKLGFQWLGCELTAEYIPIAEARIRHYSPEAAQIAPTPEPVAEPEPELLDFAYSPL